MDFFERQDKTRRNTKLLVLYFVAGVLLLILSVYLCATVIFFGVGERKQRYENYDTTYQATPRFFWWNPQLFFGVSLGTLAVIGIGTLTKVTELSQGGKSVATMLGGQLVNPHTADPDERKLLNVIEEMAIASGVPVPGVYILHQESGINAFAAGHSTSDAVIGVTQGAVRTLNRDELQGVIAHEFSHILNGDMRLNLRLMGLVFGILCIAVVGRILLQVRSSERGKNPLPLLGMALMAIGWIGVLFGRLIQAAVSREREFLADASAVQFTRNPGGLAGALKKIGGLAQGSKLQTAHAQEASHLFFGDGVGSSFLHLMDTHPPLEARIRLLDPSFDGKLPRVALPIEPPPLPTSGSPRQRGAFPLGIGGQSAVGALAGLAAQGLASHSVLSSIGNAAGRHLRYAAGLRDSFTPNTLAAAHESLGACAIIYGFLLSNDPETYGKQTALLARNTSEAVVQETVRLLPEIREIATRAKLPLVDLSLPALRQLSPIQFQQFRTAVQQLVECDGEIDLFEYMLQRIVMRHLEPQFQPARQPVTQYYALKPLAGDCATVLSALAWVGQDDPAQVEVAFDQGARQLSEAARVELALVSADHCGLAQIDAALERLSQAVPQIRKNLLNACALTVSADGLIRETEAEMLRAVADGLDCPMPPLIPARTDDLPSAEN